MNPSLRVVAMVLLLMGLVIVGFLGGQIFFTGALFAKASISLIVGFVSWVLLLGVFLFCAWSLLKG